MDKHSSTMKLAIDEELITVYIGNLSNAFTNRMEN